MTPPLTGYRLEFCTDPAEFLAAAGDHLAADPVVSTVVSRIAHRFRAQLADGLAQPDHTWWLVVRDGSGAVVSAGMRTATFPPYPPFLLPMPDAAAIALAGALHERGEEVLGVNGALPAVRLMLEELARLAGGRVEVAQHTRLHALDRLLPPAPAPGTLVTGTEDDVELAMVWYGAFMADADEQAGRPRGASAHEVPDRESLLRRLRDGRIWFWVDETGQRVHLTAANPPAFGVSGIGPVYTPPEHRGRGFASNAVAEVSRRIVAAGAQACLFTDQANPISNRIYAAVGFRPVADMGNLVIVR
jgi:GNAT superfamily N-acetyltransferase